MPNNESQALPTTSEEKVLSIIKSEGRASVMLRVTQNPLSEEERQVEDVMLFMGMDQDNSLVLAVDAVMTLLEAAAKLARAKQAAPILVRKRDAQDRCDA